MTIEGGKNDPQNYRTLNVAAPIATVEQRINDFYEEFYTLRNKYQLPNVYVIVRANVLYEGGEEGVVTSRLMAGFEANAEEMTAWALGYEQSQRQERIARILLDAGASLKRRNPRK